MEQTIKQSNYTVKFPTIGGNVWRNFNEMQIIYSAPIQQILARFLSRSLVGIECYTLHGSSMQYHVSQVNSQKKLLSYIVYSTLECRASGIFGYLHIYLESLCSLQNACYSHRAQYIWFPPMGMTGTWLKLPERTLNIICLKFLQHSCEIHL